MIFQNVFIAEVGACRHWSPIRIVALGDNSGNHGVVSGERELHILRLLLETIMVARLSDSVMPDIGDVVNLLLSVEDGGGLLKRLSFGLYKE